MFIPIKIDRGRRAKRYNWERLPAVLSADFCCLPPKQCFLSTVVFSPPLNSKLCEQPQLMQLPRANDFIFSSHYRLWRHIVYWSFHTIIWASFWVVVKVPIPFERQLLYVAIWTPGFILFSYPVIYGAIPYLLLKGQVLQFILSILAWGALGLYIDEA